MTEKKQAQIPAHVEQFGQLVASALLDAGLKAAKFTGNTVRRSSDVGFVVRPMDDNAAVTIEVAMPLQMRRTEAAEMAALESCLEPIYNLMALVVNPGRVKETARIRNPRRILSRAVVVNVPSEKLVRRLMTAYTESLGKK
jgi:hypothetical protein